MEIGLIFLHTLKEKSRNLQIVKDALEATISRLAFISFDENNLIGTYERLPMRDEIHPEIEESLIVEFYSR